jgi:hypothetical protein
VPTYRVYLSRKKPHGLSWDFSKTVVATSSDIALGDAYRDWANGNPHNPPPPLSQCDSMVQVRGMAKLATLRGSGVLPAQQAFIDGIQKQVSNFLSSQLDGQFNMIMYPSGFNYGITYGNNAYYNKATLQDIDTLLGVASNGLLDLTGAGFSTLYAQILPAVSFSFSQQDQQTMNKQDTAASAQVASVLQEFTNAGGVFTNPLPPLVSKLQDVFNQLTKQFGSLDNLPDTLNALRNAIASYKALAADSYALHNRWYVASARLTAAVANTVKPSATNGGMQVDASSYYVGYTPNKLPSANQLIGSLNTVGNAVSVEIKASNFSSSATTVSISGSVGFEIPIADILGISFSSSSSYDLSRYTSSSSDVTMDINYPGVTLFHSVPSALSADNSTGWYANDILQEVVAKTGQDATGYKLQGSEFEVADLFGPGKTFSRLKTFVISQQPTITLTFKGVDTSKVTSDFEANASLEVDLFGLFKLGSVKGSYSVKTVDTDTNAGTVTVTFGPPQVSGTIPLQQQVAYVLGGVASYPPNDI